MSGGSESVLERLDKELVRLTLNLRTIDSARAGEAPVAEFVADWLAKQGFAVRKIGLLKDCFNVLGKLPGSGGYLQPGGAENRVRLLIARRLGVARNISAVFPRKPFRTMSTKETDCHGETNC